MGGYYDIDAILTDAQKVPCTFELTVPGLGYLDGNVGGDVRSYELLAQGPTPLLTLDLPTSLSPRVLNALKADPRTVDLRALAPHFYALGARMLELFEEEEVGDVLSERAAVLADQAHNPRGAMGEGADFLRGLDEQERRLFRAAHDSAKAVRTWMAENKTRR
ncbi:DNA replication protein [Coniosporium apollinis]|uniref:DNA replication complex GINS protein PSF3 n=1 Tax=Coniosporium apollinis TaxID=61459 RepID=A0ABQ9NW89_9PEZI|nr:DNA replication protein [Coniosporium apollinis]